MKGSRWPLFLARRYFWASRRGRNIASSVLSVLQMCLGTALLIVVIGVMNGFQSGFIQSILEAGTYHVRVGFQDASREEAEALLRENPLVASVTGFMDVQVLASGAYGSSQAVNLRLVDEDAFKRDPALADSLGLDATASFAGKGASLILGGELASSIGASAGEQVEILSVRMDDELGAPLGLCAALDGGKPRRRRKAALPRRETQGSEQGWGVQARTRARREDGFL
jgi:lipoprotein-releasing system permease protein